MEPQTAKELIALIDNPSSRDAELIEKAFNFAELAHKDHKRMSGEAYFIHPYATAKKLAEIGMGAQTIAAALLHDTIEDVGVSPAQIKENFGEEILFLVEGVTKLGKIKYQGLERHAESLRKLFVATSQDVRVLIIRLMDRLHNLETLEHVREDKRHRIALETLEIYVPVADRLGMSSLKRSLEDISFEYVYPKEYAQMKKLVDARMHATLKALDSVQTKLRKELAKVGMLDFQTSSRIKGLYSLWRKLARKDNDLEKIFDIAAIRIIVPTIDDCYRALGVVHASWRPLPGRIKDFIAFPKPNGYQSLHTTIFSGEGSIIEIQIRTKEMHLESEWGVASHISYKNSSAGKKTSGRFLWIRELLPRFTKDNSSLPAETESKEIPHWIKEIVDAQTTVEKNEEFLEELKGDFFSYRVFVFTPRGDVIDLPLDSSPVDFAYAIHSDIGNRLSGAKVNGKLVSLDTHLKNGDIVEIETKKNGKPSKKWLEFSKTSMAKRHIRNALEEAQGGSVRKN